MLLNPSTIGVSTGTVRILGNLIVDGTTSTTQDLVLTTGDKLIAIGGTISNSLDLDGAGIGIGSTSIRKFIRWNYASSSLKTSENWNLESSKVYQINDATVLSSTTLGSGVTISSLRSVSSGIITDRTELTTGQISSGDYLLIYDVTDGSLKKSTIQNAALQGLQGTQGTQGLQGTQGT